VGGREGGREEGIRRRKQEGKKSDHTTTIIAILERERSE
jgi:hypothetical protein